MAFETRLVMFKLAVKFIRPTWEECGLCPVPACFTVSFDLQLSVQSRKILRQGSQEVPVSAS